MRLFIYPQHKEKQTTNPYTNNMEWALSTQFDIVHPEYRKRLPQPFRFLLNSTTAEVYVLNWIESVAEGVKLSFLWGVMAWLSLKIVFFRKAKIVWIFHNLHPHGGETMWSRLIKKQLFQKATIIVSHSQEAAEYAKKYSKCPVFFKNHPVKIVKYDKWNGMLHDCDYYIWGNIYPYKGVVELLRNNNCRNSNRKILIVGKCDDEELRKTINSYCNQNIVFENRCADFNEIAAQCRKAKYVLFPYVGNSISSSGVLMDTLIMGGTPIGPNRGAFADLAEQGCCLTYKSLDDIFNFPVNEEAALRLNKDNIISFLNDNSWISFAKWLKDVIISFNA